jgi:hypothetical protein
MLQSNQCMAGRLEISMQRLDHDHLEGWIENSVFRARPQEVDEWRVLVKPIQVRALRNDSNLANTSKVITLRGESDNLSRLEPLGLQPLDPEIGLLSGKRDSGEGAGARHHILLDANLSKYQQDGLLKWRVETNLGVNVGKVIVPLLFTAAVGEAPHGETQSVNGLKTQNFILGSEVFIL